MDLKESSPPNRRPEFIDTLQIGIDQFEITIKKRTARDQLNAFWEHQRKHASQGDFAGQSDNSQRSPLEQPAENRQRLDAIRQLRQEEARRQEEEIWRQQWELRQRRRELEDQLLRLLQEKEHMRQVEEEHRRQAEEEYRRQEEERRRQEEENRRQEEERKRQAEEELKRQKAADELRRTEELKRQYEEKSRQQQQQRTRLREEARRARDRNKERINTKNGSRAQIERYHSKWLHLRKASLGNREATLTFQQIPWPVFDPVPKKPADLSIRRIKRFFSCPDRPSIELGGVSHVYKVEMLRWHPDKFRLILDCVREEDRDAVNAGLGVVNHTLAEMNTGI